MRNLTTLLACPSVAIMFAGLTTAPEAREAPHPIPPAAMGREISVVSLNMAKATSVDAVLHDFGNAPAVREADILLLQEVASPAGSPQCAAEALAAALDRHVVWSPAATGVTDLGLAILSRWPLEDRRVQALKPYNLRFRSRSRIALSATARTPLGPVRIWNTHLDTRLNGRDRLEQLEPVVHDTNSFAGPRIIGGDFNSNPFYWVGSVLPVPFVNSQAAGLRDYMAGQGFSTPLPITRTYDYLGMHLDWVWGKGLRTSSWAVYPMRFSDHHAVWVRMAW